MKIKLTLFVSILASAALFTNCSDNRFVSKIVATPEPVKTGEMIVKFQSATEDSKVKSVLSDFSHVETLDGESKVYLVRDKKMNGYEADYSKEYSKKESVEFAEPNFLRSSGALTTPTDPLWLSLWGLKNYGQDAPGGIEGAEGADIGALDAWQVTKGDKSVVVAIIDTGIDYTHPDLAENMWVNQKEKSGVAGVDDDGNGYVDDVHGWDSVSDGRSSTHYGQVGDPDPMDDNSHGTHVAGTIGARGSNGVGVVGINWNVSLMGVKFLDANGSGSSADEYRAIKYILANKVDVVNGSYGGGGRSKLIELALQEGAQKGILFVFAAGNDSSNNDTNDNFPSNYDLPNVVAVAATDSRDRIAEFSNFGQKKVHLAAPGVNILSTIPVAMAEGGAPYASYSGTSMASPHVAGAAALLISSDASLKNSPAAVKERLMKSVSFMPHLTALVAAGGRLNVNNAILNQKISNPVFDGNWASIPFHIATPTFSKEKLDNSWPIQVPGAKAIRVHVKFADVEPDFDEALIYDGSYRPVMRLKGQFIDELSPVIVGDTAYLKFSNSLVQIDEGEPFANFNSEGVIIDRVDYLQ